MKSKDALLGDYREMTENNALQKDVAFLEVLIDIRDVLAAIEKRMHPMHDQSKERQSPPEPALPRLGKVE